MLVLDTSALLYKTLFPQKLTPYAQETIDAADKLAISSISIWEIGIKAQKGKLELPLPLAEFVEALKKVDNFEIVPVDTAVWLENLALDWEHRDPADRTIVATARLLNCPLVTSDIAIRDFYDASIW
ncbi:MAG: type II toxin-antitoxin system VapC family toxin [Anaerolineales bacterium]|nr:type II toxin-antitoxin system VapC family toxin [Anaerolineales bacterium]